jgi:hypothetical protein
VIADADVLERVRGYRSAARRIVRTDASVQDRCVALLELREMADAEPDPLIREWAGHVMWEESKDFLDMDDSEPDLPPPSYEHRARQLRSEGLIACRECFHPLPTDEELDRWELLRRRHIELLKAREGATSS